MPAVRILSLLWAYWSPSPSQYAWGPLVLQGLSWSTGQLRWLFTGVLSHKLNRLPCSPMYCMIWLENSGGIK